MAIYIVVLHKNVCVLKLCTVYFRLELGGRYSKELSENTTTLTSVIVFWLEISSKHVGRNKKHHGTRLTGIHVVPSRVQISKSCFGTSEDVTSYIFKVASYYGTSYGKFTKQYANQQE